MTSFRGQEGRDDEEDEGCVAFLLLVGALALLPPSFQLTLGVGSGDRLRVGRAVLLACACVSCVHDLIWLGREGEEGVRERDGFKRKGKLKSKSQNNNPNLPLFTMSFTEEPPGQYLLARHVLMVLQTPVV